MTRLPRTTDRTAIRETLVEALAGPGWLVLPDWLPATLLCDLRAELQARDAEGAFHAAGIGRGGAHQVQTAIRGDRIAWLREDWPAAARYLARLEDLRQTLNQSLFLALAEYEAHYAVFEAGQGYRRHVDRHAGGQGGDRVISTVCYLNEPGWPAEGGGALRLHPTPTERHDVLPEGGTLVVFRSETLPHEVLPSTRQRLSLAGWFRTRG